VTSERRAAEEGGDVVRDHPLAHGDNNQNRAASFKAFSAVIDGETLSANTTVIMTIPY
jgi:hypothetical protein